MNNNIADKNYKKLSIQVSLNGLSFYTLDTLYDLPSKVTEIKFSANSEESIISELQNLELFKSDKNLFDSICLIHENPLFSPVPSALFDKENIGDYLKFSTKTLSFDQYSYDEIENHNIHNAYIPFSGVNQVVKNKFIQVETKHITSILIKNLLDISKNSYDLQFYVHVQQKHFEIIVINKGKLQLINSFAYNTKEDFIYYTLFVAEQLKLNPETFKLIFLGNITAKNELYEITYKYVRHVSFLEHKPFHIDNNTIDNQTYSKYFTLFNA